MSQEANGSGLASLLWLLWVFGSIYWLNHQSSSMQINQEKRRHGFRRRPTEVAPLSRRAVVPVSLEALVAEVLRRSGKVTIEDFLGERLTEYERVVAAFESGNRRTLRQFVSAEVFDVFSEAIAEREVRPESVETVIVRLEPPRILAGTIEENRMEVSIRFASESFRLSRNAEGYSSGNPPDRCHSVDIWTFEAGSSSSPVRWWLVATE